MSAHPVLINGQWRPSSGKETFQAVNPANKQPIPGFPDQPLVRDRRADPARLRRGCSCGARLAGRAVRRLPRRFCKLASKRSAAEIVAIAHRGDRSGCRAASEDRRAAADRSTSCARRLTSCPRWLVGQQPRSIPSRISAPMFGPIGPVVVFGPNNFPVRLQRNRGRGLSLRLWLRGTR
jgi:alpha-ketoglutaric semialdehyde dehydrogenase